MQLKLHECACTKNNRIYCRVNKSRLGMRFKKGYCDNPGEKIEK